MTIHFFWFDNFFKLCEILVGVLRHFVEQEVKTKSGAHLILLLVLRGTKSINIKNLFHHLVFYNFFSGRCCVPYLKIGTLSDISKYTEKDCWKYCWKILLCSHLPPASTEIKRNHHILFKQWVVFRINNASIQLPYCLGRGIPSKVV